VSLVKLKKGEMMNILIGLPADEYLNRAASDGGPFSNSNRIQVGVQVNTYPKTKNIVILWLISFALTIGIIL
jgi:hypothetical protein